MRRRSGVSCCLVLLGGLLAAEPASRPTSPRIVSRDEWGSKPQPIDESKRHVPRLITLHHAGELWKPADEPMQKLRNLQSWGQRDKGWPDVPYHYLISPDGRIFEGRDWRYQPESNTKYDLNGVLNLELWGNFEVQRVSIEQLRSTVELIAHLCRTLDVKPDTIRGHRDAAENQTDCPGRDFHRYIEQGLIKRWVLETLEGKAPAVRLLEALPDGPTTMIATTRTSRP